MKRLIAVLLVASMVITLLGCSPAVSVAGAQINDSGHLILSMSDGSTIDAGNARGDTGLAGADGKDGSAGAKGADGMNGTDGVGILKAAVNDKGHLMIRLTDGTLIDTGYVMGTDGADGRDGTDGTNGTNGRDGTDGHDGADGLTPTIGTNGNWWIGGTDTGVQAGTEEFIFNDRGNGTVLLAYVGHDQDVVIPAKTTEIAEGAFEKNKSLYTVSIPQSVTKIGASAFYSCSSLGSVTLPDGLLILGDWAFSDCAALTSAYIPKSVATYCYLDPYSGETYGWGEGVFQDCEHLSQVTLGTVGVASSNYEFSGNIGAYAFENCTNLASITFPDYITWIGYRAFRNSGLSGTLSLDCRVDTEAFANTNIETLNMNLYPTSGYPEGAFAWCSSLKTINLSFDKNGHTGHPGSSGYDNMNHKYYVNIDFGPGMFRGCTALETVTIPNVTTVLVDDWNNAFGGEPQNAEVEFRIFEEAFYDCGSLKSISLPDKLGYIGESAFSDSGLETVTVPNNVSHIGQYAFGYCRNLTSFSFDGSGHYFSMGEFVFAECEKLETVTITGLTYIGDNANWFGGCASLRSVDFPQLQRLGSNAFAWSGLTSVTLAESIAQIHTDAFLNSSITTLTIKAVTPPAIFDPSTTGTTTPGTTIGWAVAPFGPLTAVYVPAASVAAYKTAWPTYDSIILPIP